MCGERKYGDKNRECTGNVDKKWGTDGAVKIRMQVACGAFISPGNVWKLTEMRTSTSTTKTVTNKRVELGPV